MALLTDLDLTFPRADSGPHLLVGYPCSRNRTGLKGDTFTARAYTLLLHDGDAAFYTSVGASGDGQFATAADRKDVWSAEGKAMAPDPYGISGGGLWKIPIDEQATVADARLAAIAVEWHQKAVPKHLLGTRIRSVLVALRDRYADLRPHIEEAVRVA